MSRKDIKYRGTQCINCETSLDISEKYCHHCGQLNSTKKLTIKDFIEEFFANFYAYDSRLRNSIISIFTKPGALAREFNEGKRHTYANPFRLFLSVSIILFITFNLTEGDSDSSDLAKKELTKEQLKEKQKQDSIAIQKLSSTKIPKTILNKLDENAMVYSKDSIYTKEQLESFSLGFEYKLISFINFHTKYPDKSEETALKELGYESSFLDKSIYKKCKKFKSNNIESELLEYFYEKLPFLIFLSLPILTLMFWIVFYSEKINYTEHLVFAYTFFTFIFLCMILFNFIEIISVDLSYFVVAISFAFLFPIYFYKSLRNFYQNSRWKTIFKFLLLNILFIPISLLAVFVLMAVSIILF